MTRYRWVDDRKAEGFPVRPACRVAQVSTSAYYAWAGRHHRGPTVAELDEAYLVNAMIDIQAEHDRTYGWRRMTAALRRAGWPVNHKKIARLMRENRIGALLRRRKKRTTIPAPNPPVVPDLVERRFAPTAPDVAWCGDITYVRTGEGWLYLASVLDLGSRNLLGYAMADHMRTDLVTDALTMAVGIRGGKTNGIAFHSDRGSQYLSADYRQHLAAFGMRQSAGRTGQCWDNAVAESLWSSLKRELLHRYRWPTRAAARQAIFAWIHRYNRTRLHSSLGYLPPVEYEQQYHHNRTVSGLEAA